MFKKLKKKNDQDKENYFLLNEEEVQDPTHLLLTTLTFASFQETEKNPFPYETIWTSVSQNSVSGSRWNGLIMFS